MSTEGGLVSARLKAASAVVSLPHDRLQLGKMLLIDLPRKGVVFAAQIRGCSNRHSRTFHLGDC